MASFSLDSAFRVTHELDRVGKGSIFFAFVGKKHDGKKFIPAALERGATHIVVEEGSILDHSLVEKIQQKNALIAFSSNMREDLALYAAKAYDFPAKKLTFIGITGTKGKTTTTLACAHAIRSLGYKVGALSSAYNLIDGDQFETNLTTPQADYIQAFLYECVQQGITHIVMEVSAQAVSLKRIHDILFDTLLFTNFSHEHGEFYTTQEEYFQAKINLFKALKPGGKILFNQDDETLSKVDFSLYTSSCKTYGTKNADYTWQCSNPSFDSAHGALAYQDQSYFFKTSSLCGLHNSSNLCAALACAHLTIQNVNLQSLVKSITTLISVPGRCQRYKTAHDIRVYIDQAHTPSSFESTLSMLRSFTSDLRVVFGCGGERDKEKRPLMTALAEQYGDQVYITLDNPRGETFKDITQEMLQGYTFSKPLHVFPDRKDAILHAFVNPKTDTIIALLGKGLETYQLIGNEKVPFSEYKIIEQRFGFKPTLN